MLILKVLFFSVSMLLASTVQANDSQFKAKGDVYHRGIIKVYDAVLYVDEKVRQTNVLAA